MKRTILLILLCGACNDPIYLQGIRALSVTGMMGGTTDQDLFVLPVRRPNQNERAALGLAQRTLALPQPVPWAQVVDFDIEVEWTVSSLSDNPVTATFSLTGGNEFGDYVPANFMMVNVQDAPVPPQLVTSEPLSLAAHQTRSGLFREDEIKEAAIDLEAIVRYPSPDGINTPFIVIAHKSTESPLGLENVPKGDITPAMVRFLVHLDADGPAQAQYTIRVRDHHGKLAPNSNDTYVNRGISLLANDLGVPPDMSAPADLSATPTDL